MGTVLSIVAAFFIIVAILIVIGIVIIGLMANAPNVPDTVSIPLDVEIEPTR